MMAKNKKSSGKKAMFEEAKMLESKGKKQKVGVPTDEAKEVIKGHELSAKMNKGMSKGKPMMGEKTAMPKEMMKKKTKKAK